MGALPHQGWKGLRAFAFRLSLLFLAVGISSAVAFAQVAITGKITGTVKDPTGAVVPKATVEIEGSALMAPRTTKTGSDGSFLFALVPPGTYQISVTAPGFQTFVQKGIDITASFTATVNPVLKVGQAQQTVSVSAAPPAVNIKSVQVSTTFNQHLLQNIPSGRDPWSTVAQTPGSTSSTVDVGGDQSMQQSTMQIHGSNPGEQLFSFNGLALNWPGANGGYTQFYTDHDALQEFQVVTDAAPASVAIGGVYMNMVTKSGSNQLHGLVSAYYGTGAWSASPRIPIYNGNPIQASQPIVMSRDTSANLGGPIIRNKWWLFGSYRRYDLRKDVNAVTTQHTIDNNHQTNTALRSDWQIGSRNRVSFVWLWNEQNRFHRRAGYAIVTPNASWLQIEPEYIMEGLWTSQITSNLLFDFRFGYNHEVFPLRLQPGVGPYDVPTIDTTLSTLQYAPPDNFVNTGSVRKFSASGSYYKTGWGGNHNFEFGFVSGVNANPYTYTVNTGLNAYYANGTPYQVVVYNSPIKKDTRFNDDAVYVQDSWTIHQRLTLNLGVRYQHWVTYWPNQTSPPAQFSNLFPSNTRSVPARGGIVSWNTASPRIGVAYDPGGRGKQVIRFSYDRYYSMEGTQLADEINPAVLATRTYKWDGSKDSNGIPIGWDSPSNFLGASGGLVTTVNPNLSRPYSEEFSVGYQREVWQNLTVRASYYHRYFRNEIGRINTAATPSDYSPITTLPDGNGNQVPIVNPLTKQPMTLYNLNAALVGQTAYYLTNIPLLNNNAYNGFEIDISKHLSHHLSLLGGFTVQRQKGEYGRGSANQAISDNFNDPNLNINRANNYLNQDSTYIFKLDGTYQFPMGFMTGVNFQHYTGFPIQPTQTFGVNGGLNQGTETVILQPAGIVRYPNINLLDIRLSRTFTFADRYKVEPLVDLYNITNSQEAVSVNQAYGPSYLAPYNLVNPFIMRLGLRFSF